MFGVFYACVYLCVGLSTYMVVMNMYTCICMSVYVPMGDYVSLCIYLWMIIYTPEGYKVYKS